jgi:CDP-4-dehydro-6-deoxyglucose reductase
MPLIQTTRGLSFFQHEDRSILDAAYASGVQLPYSCRNGRCSSCRCKVIRGESTALHEELGLTSEERSAGWILSCVRRASSDLLIQTQEVSGLSLATPKVFPCRIQALELLALDVMKVTLRLPPNSDFSFIPGQYIEIIGTDGVRRSYSLANADLDTKVIELHIRAINSGVMSQYWFERAKPNDLLRLNGPLGTFILRNTQGLDLALLATGTGIAPIKAMLKGLAERCSAKRPQTITVYWGGRTAQDLYWNVQSIQAGQRYVPVLSRAGHDWGGARGHVQDAFLANQPELSKTLVYACGSEAMIENARTTLLKAGLSETRFFSDAFVSSAFA